MANIEEWGKGERRIPLSGFLSNEDTFVMLYPRIRKHAASNDQHPFVDRMGAQWGYYHVITMAALWLLLHVLATAAHLDPYLAIPTPLLHVEHCLQQEQPRITEGAASR